MSLINVGDLWFQVILLLTVLQNWKAEFHKWLGRDRVGIVACDKANSGIDTFGHSYAEPVLPETMGYLLSGSKVHEVLIIGYERLRTVMCVTTIPSSVGHLMMSTI